MESAWHSVTTAAKEAWDAMLDVGRPATADEKLGRLQQEANAAAIAYDNLKKNPPTSTWYSQNLEDKAYYASYLADAKSRSDAATKAYHDEEHKQEADRQKTSNDALQARLVQIAADSDAEAAAYGTNAQKRAAAIQKVQGEFKDRIATANAAGNTALAAKLASQEDVIIAGINDKFKDPKKTFQDAFAALDALRAKAYNLFGAAQSASGGADSAQAALAKNEVAQLQAIAKAGAEAITKGGNLAKVQAEVADATQKTTAAFALESQQLTNQSAAAMKAYQNAIDDEIKSKQAQLDLQVEAIGMGSKEASQLQTLAAIREKSASTIEQLNRQRAQKGADKTLIDAQIAAQQAALPVLLKQQKDAYKAQDAAQADWLNGAQSAYQDYIDTAANVAGQTKDLFTNAFTGMGDAIANFVTTGKLDFKGFVVSILSDLAKMESRILASKILQSVLGSFLGSSGGNGQMATSFDSSGTFFSPYAKGDVFASSPSLSAYSGSVVSKPTMFAFAHGAGVMGEAGPEAIMPLKRGPDGKLGVATSGGSGGNVINISTQVTVDSSGAKSKTTSDSNDQVAKQLGDQVNAQIAQQLTRALQPGGLLWKQRNGVAA